MNRRSLCIGTLALVATGAVSRTFAQPASWPNRPVRMLVSSGAGGTADLVGRLVGERLSRVFGQPFVFENRAGAGGNVGAEAVARATPDGYMWLVSGSPTHSVGPHLTRNLSYDPVRDVPPAVMLGSSPNLLIVSSAKPWTTITDLLKAGGANISYGSAGNGTSGHLAAELLKLRSGLEATHVPYKSGPEAVTGVLSGAIDFLFFTVPASLPHVRSGKLRALAITSATRSALAPDVPTVAESGFPGFEVLAWYGLFVPRGTPAEIVERVSAEVEKILREPEVRDRFIQLGAEPKFLAPGPFADFVAKDSAGWGKVIRDARLKAD